MEWQTRSSIYSVQNPDYTRVLFFFFLLTKQLEAIPVVCWILVSTELEKVSHRIWQLYQLIMNPLNISTLFNNITLKLSLTDYSKVNVTA